ncbi:acyltransferase [Tessaracoccus sp. MC1679]|uniref:acyltransferase family protein n=1 Tax=Tessaracoccus sp. MC1679 TaxID=2760313 RepID=UPI0016011BC9|nr:acyltransferase family protein [Tessaracoccus sp. MC1679]MBB1517109.1 acyltransferase [Tessaracoccus sp. MC1679]
MTAPNAEAPRLLRDVQGLRAVAVLSVMAAHAGLPLPGGFVGVDIFFVISGFIITLMLLREHATHGRIRFGRFYVRRLKRLGPALAVTSIATVILAFLFLSPLGPQETTYQTALGATFGIANAVIAFNTGDYFGAAAEKNALLHTWSLSVEEQFYLALPAATAALLWASTRLKRPIAKALPFAGLAALALLSLYAIRLGTAFPFGYYGPLPRAWEFLAGCLLALLVGLVRHVPQLLLTVAGLAGAAMLAVSFVAITPETPFPGRWTLLPVAGTVLLLAAGRRGSTVLSRGLASPPMVAVGDWSYSLYLWHWPLIVVAKAVWPFTQTAPVLAAAAAFLPAYLTYRYVEQPFRALHVDGARAVAATATRILLPPAATALAAWLAVTQIVLPAMAPGGPMASRFNSVAQADVEHELQPCRDEAMAQLSNGLCGTTLPGEAQLLLIGDSHAEHLIPGFRELFPDLNFEVITVRSPKPFGSLDGVARLLAYVEQNPNLSTVIYSRQLGRDGGGLSAAEEQGMRAAVDGLANLGRKVFVLDDNPTWPMDMSSCTHRHSLALPGQICEWDASYFASGFEARTADLHRVLDGTGAEVVSIHGAFCDESVCRRATDTTQLYSDSDHITTAGATTALTYALENNPMLADALR